MLHALILCLALLLFLALSLSIAKRFGAELGLLTSRQSAYLRLLSSRLISARPAIRWQLSSFQKQLLNIVLICVAVRLAIYISAWLFQMSAQGQSGQYISFWLSFDDIWNKWDAPHYLSLAQMGYHPPAQNPLHIVFYPLYPWLIQLANTLINDVFTSAVIVSLLCYLAASWVLFKLAEKELGDSTAALNSVKYLAIFPFSLFYGTAYTESLFLLLTVSCFWFLRSEKWLLAGLCGGLAALTRNQGILLLIPMLIEAYSQRHKVALKYRILAISAAISGFLGYLLLNWWVFDNPFQFKIAQQQNWSQSFGFFALNIANIFQGALTDEHGMVFGVWLPTLVCFFAASYLLWWGRHRLAPSFQAYSLVYLLISFSPTWLLSGPRYMSVLFPLAILTELWAQQSAQRRHCLDALLLSSLILATYFFSRGWVY